MTHILFPFNAPFSHFIGVERLLEAAPLVAEHIEAGNKRDLLDVLNGLGIHVWNYPVAIEQFALGRSFQHPLDPSKVIKAKSALSLGPLALSAHKTAVHSFLDEVIAEGRTTSFGELVFTGRSAVICETLLSYPDPKERFEALVALFRAAMRDFLRKFYSGDRPRKEENLSELFLQEILGRHPDLREQEGVIRAMADRIFLP